MERKSQVYMLEFEKHNAEMRLRSSYGGSIKPFLLHLFSGGLIFESLLKSSYGSVGNTLGTYLQHSQALADLELTLPTRLYHRYRPKQGGYTLPDLINLLPQWRREDYREKIRFHRI
jgi:hypothetical protein